MCAVLVQLHFALPPLNYGEPLLFRVLLYLTRFILIPSVRMFSRLGSVLLNTDFGPDSAPELDFGFATLSSFIPKPPRNEKMQPHVLAIPFFPFAYTAPTTSPRS